MQADSPDDIVNAEKTAPCVVLITIRVLLLFQSCCLSVMKFVKTFGKQIEIVFGREREVKVAKKCQIAKINIYYLSRQIHKSFLLLCFPGSLTELIFFPIRFMQHSNINFKLL